MSSPFELVFNVPMECEGCEKSVQDALREVQGIERLNVDWTKQLVNVFGCVAPSKIVSTLREMGKDAIIRGTGAPNSAAVSILETFNGQSSQSVQGLARLVAVSDSELVVDLTVSSLEKAEYYPQIRASGNLSDGAFSTGKIFYSFDPITLGGSEGENGKDKPALQKFLKAPLNISDLIGRSFVLNKKSSDVSNDSLFGVIARSAGAWENDKYVCTCSGKTIWQERDDALKRGITS